MRTQQLLDVRLAAREKEQNEEEIVRQPEGGKMNNPGQGGKESPRRSGVGLGTFS